MNSTDSTQATLPDLDHFCMSDFEHVYEPAEDTFLLCDAIERDRRYIVDELSPAIVLEVGCGSGCVITFLSSMLKEEGCSTLCLATDINPHAINATQRTALANKVYVDAIRTNLVDGISERLQQKVDVLLFNPPYVPTPSEEIAGSGIEASWAGGLNGREVIDKFLPMIPEVLSMAGMCYMVLVQENKPKEIARILDQRYNLVCETVLRRRARNEGLMIVRIRHRVDALS